MAKPRYRYNVYKYGEYVLSGDIQTIVKHTGLSDGGIRYIADNGGTEKWWVKKQNIYIDHGDVNIDKIKELMKSTGHKTRDLKEVLGYHQNTVTAKLRGDKRFNTNDIELLEDLFFLDEGELFND